MGKKEKIKPNLPPVRGLVFDAFGTLCRGHSMASFLPWHRDLPAAQRRVLRQAWMRGEISPVELVQVGNTAAAPPPEVLEHQLQAGLSSVVAYDDVPPVLDELRRRGYRMVVASNTVTPFGRALAQVLGAWVDGYALSCEVGALKPDPRVFRAALDSLGLAPNRVLVVGDSPRNDIQGAQALGMPSVHVDRTGRASGAIATLDPLLAWLPRPAGALANRGEHQRREDACDRY